MLCSAMEIRDPIHGSIVINDAEVKVLDSLAYQRLRMIKQLGFAEFSFPGATHNRYLHSIGVCHLASLAFDAIFKDFDFSRSEVKIRLRQVTRLAALLHDIGHGPLSHTTEEVMPLLSELNLKIYDQRRNDIPLSDKSRAQDRQANHEDYTIKFITDSTLTKVLQTQFPDIAPIHIACLIDKTLACPDDFFTEQGLDFRSVLSQIISSELDADRMDYLERDAFFCGTNYGRVETNWLLSNMTYQAVNDELFLALNKRALYTFDDFLLARHHMHLMVYFHHKSIIYEELLNRYLSSAECTFRLPGNIEEYIGCNDYALYEHLASIDNEWARRITERRPYKMLFELHSVEASDRTDKMKLALEKQGFSIILANSTTRLSKYHMASPEERAFPIFVVDQYDPLAEPYPIEQTTEIFQKYEEIRRIERLYVAPEDYKPAITFLKQARL